MNAFGRDMTGGVATISGVAVVMPGDDPVMTGERGIIAVITHSWRVKGSSWRVEGSL